ncbi:FixH family protein [Actinokineospora bangkokensis]|uniref:YtkA-like domain-containing protein n=1 Tax=Actinokineospora bangkokensis TaxID=1193682 RepID=A0A1Q9LKW4_9PSEU|nr:FixH family protein [Actinokineospora bangkokensis]OLR92643.1 hypothetical protein BJP25_21635 [Actinokineospora bangkokensis]
MTETRALPRTRLLAAVAAAVVVVLLVVWLWPEDEPQELTGGSDTYAVRVVLDGPASVGDNALLVEVTDHAGAPVTADEVTVEPVMPGMGHAEPPATATAEAPGRYRVPAAHLSMAGTWEITVTVRRAGAAESTVLPLRVGN